MCGLLLAVGDSYHADFGAGLLSLKSRGPDASEVLAHGDALLGHARLAVIDLAGGRQPMVTEDERLALVYNGEIYNFPKLRRELQAAGHRFATRSDSEVLLRGYRQWGDGVVDRLQGMFAFAVHDRDDGSVFFARDRLGIKPLFWGEHGGGLVVASTLAPFFELSAFPKRLDAEGLRDYLAFQTPLAPRTLIRDIRALPPGVCAYWKAGSSCRVRQWWSIPHATEKHPDQAALIDETDGLLKQAVEEQLIADVPLGAFLSGGIDSSLIVHYMSQAGVGQIKTFSVRFQEAGFDESPAAKAVADQYATTHQVLDAPELSVDTLSAALADLDQPLADPAYIPTWALSRLTRQHVAVALSGDGGDELFAGYPRFLDTADRYPSSASRRLLGKLLRHGLAPGSLTRRSLSGGDLLLYRRVELGDYAGSRKDIRRYLDPSLVMAARPENTLQGWHDLVRRYGDFDRAALLRADLWSYLSENCLTKTDRASMAHGLEVRVPLLADVIQDRMLSMPAGVHFDAGGGKAILRALARRHLPEVVWNREKHGFSVPLRANLAGSWREWREAQVAAVKNRAPWLDADAIAALDSKVSTGRGSVRLLYTFLVLLAWLEKHNLDIQPG